jgi:hypothetical protein
MLWWISAISGFIIHRSDIVLMQKNNEKDNNETVKMLHLKYNVLTCDVCFKARFKECTAPPWDI